MRRLPLNVPQVAPLIDTHSVTYTLGEFYAKGGNNEYQKYPTCNSHSNTLSANIWIPAQIIK